MGPNQCIRPLDMRGRLPILVQVGLGKVEGRNSGVNETAADVLQIVAPSLGQCVGARRCLQHAEQRSGRGSPNLLHRTFTALVCA